MSGGLVAALRAQGTHVTYVIATNGDKGCTDSVYYDCDNMTSAEIAVFNAQFTHYGEIKGPSPLPGTLLPSLVRNAPSHLHVLNAPLRFPDTQLLSPTSLLLGPSFSGTQLLFTQPSSCFPSTNTPMERVALGYGQGLVRYRKGFG